MAERLGVSQPVVSDYERGALRLHGLKVAEILRVSADDLLGRETNKPKARPAGKVQQLFEGVFNLLGRQQDKWSSSSPPSSASNSKPKSKKQPHKKAVK
jgi:hypothetical protein